jgi:predicted nucleic acid-binding protein
LKKVLFDTSVLVAAIWAEHPKHLEAIAWLVKVRKGQLSGAISQHTLLETYSALTGMPSRSKLSPAMVRSAVLEATSGFEVVQLDKADYLFCLESADSKNLSGPVVYDLLIFNSATKSKASQLLTANSKDFIRVADAAGPEITTL